MSIALAIFGIDYWPEPTGTALNTAGLASALAARGWDVSVVTGLPHYPGWRVTPAPSSEVKDGVRIRRYAHYVPRTQSALRRGVYEATWYLSALRSLVGMRRPDVILGVSPSLGGLALARTASLVTRRPYCALFQDLLGRAAEQSAMPGGAAVSGIVTRAERWLASDAAAVMVVAEGFRSHFAGTPAADRVARVRNPARLVPAEMSRDEARAALGWRTDESVVLHIGAIGYKQDLARVLDAAALPGAGKIRFVIQGEGSLRASLEAAARSRGLANVTFRELDRADALPVTLAAADALLLHQRAGVRNMSMPAKLGTYLAAGRPIVAAVEADDEVAREIHSSGAGVVVAPGDPEALLGAVTELRSDPARAAALGRSGREFARRELSEEAAIDAIGSILANAARGVRSGAE